MGSAELKNKRVRHSYPRKEIYHRFIHEDTFVYNHNSNPCWAVYNWLFAGKCYSDTYAKESSLEDCRTGYAWNTDHLIAVLDRHKKQIVITTKYTPHYYDIARAVPDDWKVFLTDNTIPSMDILSNKEALCKLAITYHIERFATYYLAACYRILEGSSRVLNVDITNVFSKNNYAYSQIVEFAKENKLSKYDWYKTSINEKFGVSFNLKSYWNKTPVALPSVYDFVRNKVFTKQQFELLKQYYFYTRYCYGRGISFKTVQKEWNKPCDTKKLASEHTIKYEAIKDCTTWNEAIPIIAEIDANIFKRNEEECIKKSEENYRNAHKKLSELISSNSNNINDWREFKNSPCISRKLPFDRYRPSRRRNRLGNWETAYVYSSSHAFNNVQLRLTRNKNVETSRGAVVPYESAKVLWRLFIHTINSKDDDYFDFDKHHIRVGIYNLRFIMYHCKVDDTTSLLIKDDTGKLDWLIQVGCHRLWLSDILEFIKYYKLEADFPTNDIRYPDIERNETNN